jgi:hypothetical protein
MASAAQLTDSPEGASWSVTRDGAPIAVVAVRHEGGNVVVAAELAAPGAARAVPHRFQTLQAAETYVNDLIASFSYLGCDVGPA